MFRTMKERMLSAITVVLLPFVVAACGGGGGGSNDSGLSYTGSTSRAVITENNAGDIATEAYQGGKAGSPLDITGVVRHGDNGGPVPRILGTFRALENALNKADIESFSRGITSGAVQSESDRILGDCGGYADFTINYDDVTGEFDGTMSFHGFCSDNVFISGSTTFSGNIDPGTGLLTGFTFTFNELTSSSGSDSFTLDGRLTLNATTSSSILIMNLLLKDNGSGKVYRLEDYSMVVTDGTTYTSIEISGRFYEPDYGYVDISTSVPLRILNTDDWPSYGVMVLAGRTGIAGGSTKAKLTALSSTQYRVEADTDGDGSYDYNSGPLDWTDL